MLNKNYFSLSPNFEVVSIKLYQFKLKLLE